MFRHITSWIYVAWFLYPRRSDCFCRSSTSFSSISVFSFIHLDWYAVSIRLRVSEFRHFRVTGKKWGYFNVTLHLLSSYRNCDVKIQRVIINEKCVSIYSFSLCLMFKYLTAYFFKWLYQVFGNSFQLLFCEQNICCVFIQVWSKVGSQIWNFFFNFLNGLPCLLFQM